MRLAITLILTFSIVVFGLEMGLGKQPAPDWSKRGNAMRLEALAPQATAGSYPGMDPDSALIAGGIELSQLVQTMRLEEPTLKVPGNNASFLTYKSWAETYPPLYEAIVELQQKYGNLDPREAAEKGPYIGLLIASRGQTFVAAQEALDRFSQAGLPQAQRELEISIEAAEQAYASGEYQALLDDQRIKSGEVFAQRIAGIHLARTDNSPGLDAQYQALSERATSVISSIRQRAFDAIVATNEPVSDVFAGDQGPLIKEMVASRWQKAYPDANILEVRISDRNWYQIKDKRWKNGKLVERHIGLVDAWVIVARERGMASQHSMLVEKDFLRGGALSISFGGRWYGELNPEFTVLQSKL